MKRSLPSEQKPAGASILRRACLETGIPLTGLVTATAAKIKMKAWKTDVSTIAAEIGTMTGVVTATITVTWAAAMADDAVTIDGMTVAVVAGDGAFAIHWRAARAAVVRETATGAVAVKRLRGGGREDSKAGGQCEEGDEFFHSGWRVAFDLLPRSCGVFIRRGAPAAIRDSSNIFLLTSESQGVN